MRLVRGLTLSRSHTSSPPRPRSRALLLLFLLPSFSSYPPSPPPQKSAPAACSAQCRTPHSSIRHVSTLYCIAYAFSVPCIA
eukprot:3101642-Rhodomonas_salina.1